MEIRRYLSLFKLRICSLITFSAVVGAIATQVGGVSPDKIAFLILATMLASMGASAFNHYFDRDIDIIMDRTRNRPITSGEIGYPKVVLLGAVLLLVFSLFISTRALNYMVALHLFLGAFVYTVIYTVWLKRRSWLNIVIGGLAGSFSVLAGGASSRPELCLPPILLAIIMFFWTPSHFWSFAIVHREEYERAGVPMLPVLIGETRTAFYILLNTILLVVASLLPSLFGYRGPVYLVVAIGVGAFFIWRNIQLLFNPSKDMAWKNFKASMSYLGVLFLGVILDVSIS